MSDMMGVSGWTPSATTRRTMSPSVTTPTAAPSRTTIAVSAAPARIARATSRTDVSGVAVTGDRDTREASGVSKSRYAPDASRSDDSERTYRLMSSVK